MIWWYGTLALRLRLKYPAISEKPVSKFRVSQGGMSAHYALDVLLINVSGTPYVINSLSVCRESYPMRIYNFERDRIELKWDKRKLTMTAQ